MARGKMKGALPVPYIVAIIIAIIVIALLIYWFFVLRNQGIDVATLAVCQAKLITYCSQWSSCGYEDTCLPKDRDGNPVSDFYVYASECISIRGKPSGLPGAISPTECRAALGQGGR